MVNPLKLDVTRVYRSVLNTLKNERSKIQPLLNTSLHQVTGGFRRYASFSGDPSASMLVLGTKKKAFEPDTGFKLKRKIEFLDTLHYDHIKDLPRIIKHDPGKLLLPKTGVGSLNSFELLSRLSQVKKKHCIFDIKGKSNVAGVGDVIRVDWIKDLDVGDRIVLDRVREIAGKNFTIKGNPYIRKDYYVLEGVVIEHMISKEVTRIVRMKKRRRFIFNYMHYTSIRITKFDITSQNSRLDGKKKLE